MFLKKLDIKGFKSFADNTEIILRPDINILVGPNGCGKSNIVDAIRWVLGESNIRNLRGQKGEDVIFNGTDNKRALGMAYVEMTLDNSDQLLPVDYNEICIGRKIFRSGESEFYLNRNRVRMKDIAAFFTGTGLGKKGYSIISQGELEQVLKGQALDRRFILEEAAGIIKFRQQRDETKHRLLNTANDLLRLGDILTDLQERRDELQYKAEKAGLYLQFSEELQSLERKVLHFELSRAASSLEQKKIAMAERENEVCQVLDEIGKNEARLLEEEAGLKEKAHRLAELRDELHRMESAQNSMLGELRLSEERVKNKRERIGTAELDAVKYDEMLAALKRDLEMGMADYQQEEEKYRERLQEFQELETELSEQKCSIHFLQESLEEKKSRVFDRIKEESQLKNEITESEDNCRRARDKKERLSIHIQELGNKLVEEKQNRSIMEKEKRELQEEILVGEAAMEEVDREKAVMLNSWQLLDNVQHKLEQESIKIRNKLLAIKDMQKNMQGYSAGVKAVLSSYSNGSLDGIRGIVGEIIDVPRGMEIAIDVAAGRGLENIIVERIEDARAAIDFLKRNREGRVTFLPLDILKVKKVPAALLSDLNKREGVLGLAPQLLGFRAEFSKAVEYLLGRVLIVENMDYGIKVFKGMEYPLRIVSLDGELLNPSGAISGGHRTGQSSSPLLRRGEEKKLIALQKENRSAREENRQEAEKIKQEIAALDNRIASLRDALRENRFRQEMLEKQLENLKVAIESREKEKLLYFQQIERLDQEIISMEKKILELENRKNSMQNENELVNTELEKLKEGLERMRRDYEVRQERLNSYREQLDMKQRELENIRKNTAQFEQVKVSYQNSMDEARNLKERLEKGIYLELDKIAHLNRQIGEQKMAIQELSREMAGISEADKVQRRLIDSKRREILPIRQKNNELEHSIRNMELSIARMETEMEGLRAKWWEKFSADFPDTKEEPESLAVVKEYRKRIEALRVKIEEIGTVDLDSITEYQQIKERFDFVNGQYQDLNAGRISLESLLQETEKIMARDFTQFLHLARESFNKTFSEIFGGGEAYLRLENTTERLEAGVDIEVKMPGKKIQSLSLLSGGERALTCIAFIFSLLRLKPAPFCLLDEIDASLDDTNLHRFCRFLKAMTDDMQFIVISHRQATIESGESILGITMPEKGVSSVLSIDFMEAKSLAG